MTAGFLFGFGFLAGAWVFCSVMHHGLVRTIVGLLKVVFMGAATVAAVAMIILAVFHLTAIEQPDPQAASARAPAGNWLDEKP